VNNVLRINSKAKYLRIVFAGFFQIIAYLVGIASFAATSIGAAAIIDMPIILIVLGLVATVIIVMLISWLPAFILRRERKWKYAVVQGIATATFTFLIIAIFFLQPLVPNSDQYVISVPDQVEFWDLPTGSTVAIRKIEGQGAIKSEPIIYLHGGPGAYSVSWQPTVEAMSKLSAEGHDIYLYDQVGGGLSERLANISEYSLERHIDDLEAMRQLIGVDQVNLLGSSFGATLAANYMAKYPSHVSKAVFFSPGPIYLPEWLNKSDGNIDDKMTPNQEVAFDKMIAKPRLFAAIILAEINPNAAVRFASEREMGSFFDQVANTHYLPLTTCEPQANLAHSIGYGFWSNRMTGKTLSDRSTDPKPSLRENPSPVLVLRGECDYKNEAVARQYASTFQNSTYVPIMDAGHLLYVEQQDEFVKLVSNFLNQASE